MHLGRPPEGGGRGQEGVELRGPAACEAGIRAEDGDVGHGRGR
jgi:hypothetical protein